MRSAPLSLAQLKGGGRLCTTSRHEMLMTTAKVMDRAGCPVWLLQV